MGYVGIDSVRGDAVALVVVEVEEVGGRVVGVVAGAVTFGWLDNRWVVRGERAGRGVEPVLVDSVRFADVREKNEVV